MRYSGSGHLYRSVMLLSICLTALLFVILIAGCRGGVGGADPTPLAAAGTVTLPQGSSLQMSDLQVMAASGTVSVDADRKFTAPEPDGGPAMVALMNKAGKLIMLGHVDADDPDFGEINARTTAVELLFTATLACTLPVEQWPRVYELLDKAPQTDTLAEVISARIAANPMAVEDEDPQIQAAVENARTAQAPSAPAQGVALRGTAKTAKSPAAKGLDIEVTRGIYSPLSVQVVSENPPGLMVLPSEDGRGIIVQNWFRIHREVFVYRTSTTNSDGITTNLAKWEPVERRLFLPAVTGVTSDVGALSDYYVGDKTARAPKQTDVIPLPLSPDAPRGITSGSS